MVILGVDPGLANCGISAVMRFDNPIGDKKYDVITSKRAGVGPRRPEGERIDTIAKAFEKMLDGHTVSGVGIEKIFFARNKSSAMKVAEVIGVIKYICHQKGKVFYEFTPNDVKAAIGAASGTKEDVAKAVRRMTGRSFNVSGGNSHESDATAVALAFFEYLKED